MYPITVPNVFWVYLCSVFANVNTPAMLIVAETGQVPDFATMGELGKEVSYNVPNRLNNDFFTWINLQTNVESPNTINTVDDVSYTVYPIAIPDPNWLYLCSAFATEKTPTITNVGQLGYVKDAYTMLLLFSELTLILQNGNPSMNRFFDWTRFNRNAIAVDDPGSDFSLLESF